MKDLKQLLRENGKTQRNLAEKLNVHETTITGYVKKRCQMTYEQLCKTADFLNVSIDYLLDHDVKKPLILCQEPPKPKNTVITYDKYGNKLEVTVKEQDLLSINTLLNTLATSRKI